VVDRAAADDREDVVPAGAGVREPLEREHDDPFAAAIAIGVGRERLAAAVGGQRPRA
jgi:hypothetical protein